MMLASIEVLIQRGRERVFMFVRVALSGIKTRPVIEREAVTQAAAEKVKSASL